MPDRVLRPRLTPPDKGSDPREVNPLDEVPSLAEARGGAFYLYGDDEFRKDEIVRALVDAHLDEATRDFNLDLLRGSEVDVERLASVLATPPMMAQWRVVVVRDVEGLASSARSRDVLLAAASSPPPGLALVMSCTPPSGSKAKFYRDLARVARSVALEPLTPDDVPGWVMSRARDRHGLTVEPDAARALGAAIGPNLGALARELEKLADYVGERRTLTAEDVEAAGTSLPTQDRWRWFDLVGERRFEEALRSLGVLMAQSENGVGLVIGLTTQLLRVGMAVEGGPRALEAVLPPHQRWLAGRLAAQARGWRREEVEEALRGLLRADRILKSSPLEDEAVVAEWLLGMMARRRAA